MYMQSGMANRREAAHKMYFIISLCYTYIYTIFHALWKTAGGYISTKQTDIDIEREYLIVVLK